MVYTSLLEGQQNEKERNCCLGSFVCCHYLSDIEELMEPDEEYPGQKEFEEYCRNTPLPSILWFALAGVLMAAFLLGECIHAGLQ